MYFVLAVLALPSLLSNGFCRLLLSSWGERIQCCGVLVFPFFL